MNYKSLTIFSKWSLAAVIACGSVLPSARAEVSDKDFSSSMEKYLASDSGTEKIGTAMEKYFQKKQQDAMKQQEQQAGAEMEEQFKSPVTIENGKSATWGPPAAKVTIVEFSDFQCPYCRRGFDTMEEVAKMYPNDVKFVFKHYPLPFHKEAEPAAKAAWAAQQQGKFLEYHEALFKGQDKLGAQFYLDLAKELKLDVDKFKKDMASEDASKQVQADTELGAKNGIQGTPGFFVNGVAVRGAYPASHFKTIIDRWLKGADKKA